MNTIRRVIQKVPGERVFGVFRFLPIFFLCGAALEFTMVKWEVNGINFYKTYKRRRAEEIAAQELYRERLVSKVV